MAMAETTRVEVTRLDVRLNADPTRVLLRRYGMSSPQQVSNVIARVLALSEPEVEECWQTVSSEFSYRHRDYEGACQRRFEEMRAHMPEDQEISPTQVKLLGASFFMEYALECAALFNPSIVAHPDQSGVAEESLRFILSLRATGEGHISSITFRVGVIDADGGVTLEEGSRFVEAPTLAGDAEGGFSASFPDDVLVAEQALFPVTPSQSSGIEDARFVQFEDGTYYGTYTAYDGRDIAPEMVETRDFQNYRFLDMKGPALKNKGLALFPRKINGAYWMLGRQDGESLFLMRSENLLEWNDYQPLATPVFDWEMVQIGNCGSPLETEAGWLVLTHGVGPTRKYSIGVLLLDKDDPGKVIGRLEQPILSPNADEREGYVPNVVYTCGGIIHGEHLIVPYAISDSASRFARFDLKALLATMA